MAHRRSLLGVCDGWLSAEKACASPSSIPLFHARNKGCIDLRQPCRSSPGSVALGAVERVFARSSSGSDPFEIPIRACTPTEPCLTNPALQESSERPSLPRASSQPAERPADHGWRDRRAAEPPL